MSGEEKEVFLERAGQGSFGFSILGGAGMKYPACVCEVDDSGPADLSKMVRGLHPLQALRLARYSTYRIVMVLSN